MIIQTPPYLKPGDTIGIVCPAGYMAFEKASECVRILQEVWGYKVIVGGTLGSKSATYFSGTDQERLNDFQKMLDDDEVQAVLCGRGGYGMGRIIEKINFKKFEKKPKWVIGFSDITIFHSHLYSNYRISSIHGPMAAAFNDGEYNNKYVQSLKDALEGKWAKYSCDIHELNRNGEAVGELVGGNLALLVHGIGTDSEMKTKGRILFIEDIGEQKYSIDRMMCQLKRSGKLDKLEGLIVGGFSDVQDTDRTFGQGIHQIIYDFVKEYKYPVCFDFPVSHEKENYAIKIGAGYKLKVGSKKVTLEE
ncbi:MAG TPA: LD-carboxypeptidase [Niabella sp.]|nr:LD-carboxypeptidase [Niabella sp.]HOZ96191.1 LD-carboxypeptidase [Niabella sp.]HQW13556.1 LD-carboxypeptidase [Niabella sp.]HQX18950.1 LD-carboxypeptidase [Niabella sp.]HQX40455.1 LD-carboxypeptidase [Niabella sp.]